MGVIYDKLGTEDYLKIRENLKETARSIDNRGMFYVERDAKIYGPFDIVSLAIIWGLFRAEVKLENMEELMGN